MLVKRVKLLIPGVVPVLRNFRIRNAYFFRSISGVFIVAIVLNFIKASKVRDHRCRVSVMSCMITYRLWFGSFLRMREHDKHNSCVLS